MYVESDSGIKGSQQQRPVALTPAIKLRIRHVFRYLSTAQPGTGRVRWYIDDRPVMTQSIEATLAIQAIGSVGLPGCAPHGVWL